MIECSICKAHNEDRSLYCLECGQRLRPKFPDLTGNQASNKNITTDNTLPKKDPYQSSGKLHSPILDLDQDRKNRDEISFANSETNYRNSDRAHNISRNGLHSPLLDGKNHFVNPYPKSNLNSDQDSESENPEKLVVHSQDKFRLHSPVLDGPFLSSNNADYIEEEFPAEEQEYESLRSPLLKAKVPLPETSQPERPGPTIKSVLNSAPESSDKIDHENVWGSKDAPLSVNGINKFQKANSSRSFNKIAIDPKRSIKSSSSLLPADEEIAIRSVNRPASNNSSFNKTITVLLIFLAVGFKIWFFLSLGSSAYSSTPFVFDQVGQVLVMTLVLFLALNIKN